MVYNNNYGAIKGYIIIGAMLCYLFITETLGPQLWHIPSVLTAQFFLLIIYFVYSYNSQYNLFTKNKCETLILITGCTAMFIRYANGYTNNVIFYFITTYILPIIILLSLKYTPIRYKKRIKTILYIFYIIECSLAIFERIIQYSFFPFANIENFAEYQAIHQVGSEFRSCSMLGNPLTNALIVMTMYPFLLFDLKKKWHILFFAILTLLGLSSFNARGATLIFFFVSGIYYFYKWILNGKRKTLHLILFVLLVLLILMGFSQTEMAGRLFHGGKVIDDSAQSRLTIFSQLDSLTFIDYFFGNPSKTALFSENGFINFIILNGLPFLIFYLYTYFKTIKYYLHRYSTIEKTLIFISSFGVAALNPSFTSNNYIIFLIFGLTIFPTFKTLNYGKRFCHHPIIQQRRCY